MQNVPKALRLARLPKLVETTTLTKIGQQGLRDAVQNEEYRSIEGPVSFRVMGGNAPQLIRASAVFCKELVLSNVKALYAGAAWLHHLCCFHDRHGECEEMRETDDMYLVVPDLFANDWYATEASRRLVYEFLMTHYYRGNGLAICEDTSIPSTSRFGDVRFDQFVEGFKPLSLS